eukprot:IDg10551t1
MAWPIELSRLGAKPSCERGAVIGRHATDDLVGGCEIRRPRESRFGGLTSFRAYFCRVDEKRGGAWETDDSGSYRWHPSARKVGARLLPSAPTAGFPQLFRMTCS